MVTNRRVIVNPAENDDGPLHVEDDLGRLIKKKPAGNDIPWTPHIQRRINFGELKVLKQKRGATQADKPDQADKPATPKKKKEE